MSRYLAPILLCFLIISCRPETYIPKPRGYYLIETPPHTYQHFDQPGFPYSFDYPTYATIIRDTSYFGEKPENPYWLYIDFPTLGGRIYLSYKQITAKQPLGKLLEDAHKLSFFHDKRADFIHDSAFQLQNNVYGIAFNVGGDAASAYQFIATDTVKHWIRAALYFDVTPNADSLKPVNNFLKVDMEHMLRTLRWKY